MKSRVLCILHRSPPFHGAAKVGDFVANSDEMREQFNCKFITIKSSDSIADIGKISFKKIYLVFELYLKVMLALILFRPHKIYFTASVRGVAFYRDLFISTLWRFYSLFRPVETYYHYHTKGVNEFVSLSRRNLKLTNFFVSGVKIVLLSPVLAKDFSKLNSYNQICYLPNGVENALSDFEFESMLVDKYECNQNVNVLYLSNMIKSKGYFEVLKLAAHTKEQSIHYHFAGGWQSEQDEKGFLDFTNTNKLENRVTFHGFVDGDKKKELFKNTHIFMFPTRYPNEAFPLTVLEALSYGVFTIATDEASIPYILDEKSGLVIGELKMLSGALNQAIVSNLNMETSKYCRERFNEKFSLAQFEKNLVKVLSNYHV